jgi:hypothetical protein
MANTGQVAKRYNQLKDQGTLSAKRLPRIREPPRPCTHWDYLLMEMAWMSRDYTEERKWKVATARAIAHEAVKYHFKVWSGLRFMCLVPLCALCACYAVRG